MLSKELVGSSSCLLLRLIRDDTVRIKEICQRLHLALGSFASIGRKEGNDFVCYLSFAACLSGYSDGFDKGLLPASQFFSRASKCYTPCSESRIRSDR